MFCDKVDISGDHGDLLGADTAATAMPNGNAGKGLCQPAAIDQHPLGELRAGPQMPRGLVSEKDGHGLAKLVVPGDETPPARIANGLQDFILAAAIDGSIE